jgi:formate/nitrite transporter FocA (FNT family)
VAAQTLMARIKGQGTRCKEPFMPREQPLSEPAPTREPSTQLAGHELDEMRDRSAPRALVLHEAIRKEGEEELIRPVWSLFWSGLAAGLSIGLSMIGMGLLQAHLPDEPWRRLVTSFGYTFGFLVVILGRQQLFTENTVTAVLPLLHAPGAGKLWAVARLWIVVLAANVLGTLLFAAGAAFTDAFGDTARDAFRDIGVHAAGHGFGATFVKAIVAGWLIALMVWVLPGAGEARFWVVIVLTYVIALAELAHIVAGSAEVAFAAMVGALGWREYAFGFMLPTFLGNVLGGIGLVALLNHGQVHHEL